MAESKQSALIEVTATVCEPVSSSASASHRSSNHPQNLSIPTSQMESSASSNVFNFSPGVFYSNPSSPSSMARGNGVPSGANQHKSVCFHSVTGQPGAERKITNAIDCLQYMINGTTLVKAKASMRQYRRFYTLEEDLSMIRWVPSTKKTSKAKLIVKSIREVRPGKNTEVLKAHEITGLFSEDCTFSIIYGDDFESIDLIALSPEEANIWVTGLNFLIRLIKSPDSLEGRQRMREKWLLDVFDEADADRKGMLDELDTIALMKRLNERLSIKSLKQKIVEFELSKKNGEQRGCISKHAFISLFTQTATRPDVYFTLVRYCGRDYMTVEELQLFLEGEQGITDTSLELCAELIDLFEPSNEARQHKQFLIDGFTQFLISEACNVMSSSFSKVDHDMNKPFAHYFISTSHNTYLIEDQVKGPSSVEGYIKALQAGFRCIKIDCQDGPDGPLVYNANTLTGRVALVDVLIAIRDNAFLVSPLAMQSEAVRILQDTLGDLLFLLPEASCAATSASNHNHSPSDVAKPNSISSASSEGELAESKFAFNNLTTSRMSIDTNGSGHSLSSNQSSGRGGDSPKRSEPGVTANENLLNEIWSKLTPAQLKNKIIILGKKTNRKDVMAEEVSEEEDENSDKERAQRKKLLLGQELSKLVSLVRINGTGGEHAQMSANYYEVVHHNESTALKLAWSVPEELVQGNKTHLMHVSPDVSRIDSSNLNPLDLWNSGVQMVAMNCQTNGQIMDLYRGWFSQNGSSGYVLKPRFMRDKFSTFNVRRKDIMPGIDPVNVRVKILSGQQLPRPKGASLKANSIDPYVRVQCLGVPNDCAESRTRTVSNDGHDPIFDESFDFKISVPELAVLRFLVLDDEYINDDFIGQLTIPVSLLTPGYKHVRLQDMNGEIKPNASLFIKVALTQRYGSKQKLRRKRSWTQKNTYETKQVGIKNVDEQMKAAFVMVNESVHLRKNVEKGIIELCDECSLPESANMAQCLRIIIFRLASCPTIISCKISNTEAGHPGLLVAGEPTPKLSRILAILDKTLSDFHSAITNIMNIAHPLEEVYRQISKEKYEHNARHPSDSTNLSAILDNLRAHSSPKGVSLVGNRLSDMAVTSEHTSPKPRACASKQSNEQSNEENNPNMLTTLKQSSQTGNPHHGSTGSGLGSFKINRKSGEKITENFLWNLSIIKTELDSLHSLRHDCKAAFKQINRIASALEIIFEREHKLQFRSNSRVCRELNNISLMSQPPLTAICGHGQLMCSNSDPEHSKPPPLSPIGGEGHLRSILKKSTSPTMLNHQQQQQQQQMLDTSSERHTDHSSTDELNNPGGA